MLTKEQRETRIKFLGSSDIASIIGLSPWRTAYDVWAEKTGRLNGEGKENDAMEVGTRVEPVLLNWCADRIGKLIQPDTQFVHSNGIMIASLDGLIRLADGMEHVEAKVSSSSDGWGSEGTDDIPDHYLLQVAHQFACVPQSRLCHVPVLRVGFGAKFEYYAVTRESAKDLIATVEEQACEFWHKHVMADIPPEGSASMDVLKRIRREPGKVAQIPDAIAEAYAFAKDAAKAAEEKLEQAEAAFLQALGDADAADTCYGRYTYRTQTRTSLDADAIKAVFPDWSKYQKQTLFPVLREPSKKGK